MENQQENFSKNIVTDPLIRQACLHDYAKYNIFVGLPVHFKSRIEDWIVERNLNGYSVYFCYRAQADSQSAAPRYAFACHLPEQKVAFRLYIYQAYQKEWEEFIKSRPDYGIGAGAYPLVRHPYYETDLGKGEVHTSADQDEGEDELHDVY